MVLSEVICKGLNVVEVAHDNSPTVKNVIERELKLKNSYDTWHGTKNVARLMTKIATGPQKTAGVQWFPQLSDKRKSTKVHLYYCMKNNDESPEKLRINILNIVKHYQNQHDQCSADSHCQQPGYEPTKVLLTDPATIHAYEKMLKETLIYKNAESYCKCRDTYWVESFNHALLTYLPKRIHFDSEVFRMRMNLACMDWNENVDRAYTSTKFTIDLRRPDRRTLMKVLVKNSYSFVDDIWELFLQNHCQSLSPFDESEDHVEVHLDLHEDRIDELLMAEYTGDDDD
jgi:hypothetical protein